MFVVNILLPGSERYVFCAFITHLNGFRSNATMRPNSNLDTCNSAPILYQVYSDTCQLYNGCNQEIIYVDRYISAVLFTVVKTA